MKIGSRQIRRAKSAFLAKIRMITLTVPHCKLAPPEQRSAAFRRLFPYSLNQGLAKGFLHSAARVMLIKEAHPIHCRAHIRERLIRSPLFRTQDPAFEVERCAFEPIYPKSAERCA